MGVKNRFVPEATALAGLFDMLREMPFPAKAGTAMPDPMSIVPSVAGLRTLLAQAREPLEATGRSGLFGNPWTAAALRRDEVRNASVLRWFLDPNGGHGCGGALLGSLLLRIRAKSVAGFQAMASERCRVTVEECPDGDRSSRVDIQIDDPAFFLIIEIKIDAGEQPDQLKRYGDIAEARAAGRRPWAIVYLTRDGRAGSTVAEEHLKQVVCLSWGEIAADLRRIARRAVPASAFLARAFASHVSSF